MVDLGGDLGLGFGDAGFLGDLGFGGDLGLGFGDVGFLGDLGLGLGKVDFFITELGLQSGLLLPPSLPYLPGGLPLKLPSKLYPLTCFNLSS